MSFFQNPFVDEFAGNWLLGDRHHIPTFIVKGNAGRGKETVMAWNDGPYDLSGNDADGDSTNTLTIWYCLYHTKNWASLSVNIAAGAASAAAVTPAEVVAALLANTTFASRFDASIGSYNEKRNPTIQIRQKKPITDFKFYIANGRADSVLGFNVRAGVAELPTYFARHTIAERFNFVDSQGVLIELDPAANDVDANIIDNAVDARGLSLGYDSGTVQEDWELLRGRSGIFEFQKGPSVNAVSTTEVTILYPAGAQAGDLAMKITVQKDASAVTVNSFKEPYTLTTGDLITPP